MRIDNLHMAISARLAIVDINATLQTAAFSLSRPGIGLVVVCDGAGTAAGVLSRSDLVRHLATAGAAGKSVAPAMSRPVIFCGPSDDVHHIWQTMTARNLQNVPVLDASLRPLGILDVRDAMQVLFEQEQIQEQMLVDYITGVGYR